MTPDPSTRRIRLWQRYVYRALEGAPRRSRLSSLIRNGLIALICLKIISMMLETVAIMQPYMHWLVKFELVSVAIFSVEYVLRVWSAVQSRDHRLRHPLHGRLRYMRTPLAIVDLLAILPFYISIFFPLADFRFLRLFRLVRMVKIMRYSPAFETLGRVFYNERFSALAAFWLMVVMLIFGSTVIFILEHEAQPDEFSSIPKAMWWTVATLSTVGYGDIVPITAPGKIFGGFLAIMGIGLFTLPAAILANGFMREIKKRDFLINFQMVSDVPLFKGLNARTIAEITGLLRPETVPARYTILRRNEAPEALFFIANGEVEIDVIGGPDRVLKQGDFFGDLMHFDDDEAHQGTAVALEDTRLLVLNSADLRRLLNHFPDLNRRLIQLLKQRDYKG